MPRRRCRSTIWPLLLVALSAATPSAEAWAQAQAREVPLQAGTPAPFDGLLLSRERAALIPAMAADLEQAEADLVACQATAIAGPAQVAQAIPDCPEPPPERSPWPDRAIGAVGGSVGTAIVILAIILLTPG